MLAPGNTIGDFQNTETGKWFSFRANTCAWGKQHGYEHEIDTVAGPRSAMVLKSRVYVVVDEDEHGNPVAEKWLIKRSK